MYFKTFNKLNINTKKEILLENNLLYNLKKKKGLKALKKEFKLIKPMIKKSMIKRKLYK